jgi:hypothetical protein
VEKLDGVERVLSDEGKRTLGLDHARSGELVAISQPDRWFTYYYWLDDARAPDFARTVDIHRKPGYDPAELFMDPHLAVPKVRAMRKLGMKKLGFRTLMDVIGLDASVVKGSHGRVSEDDPDAPVLISSEAALLPEGSVAATAVHDLVLSHVFD